MFAAVIFVVCALSGAQAKVLPQTAKLVPPETIFLVEIDDFQQFKTQFEKTSLYKLYKDPAMAAFFVDFKAKWSEKIQQLDENDIFKTIVDADVLPQGRLAIALVFDEQPQDPNNPPILFITQWGEGIAKIKESVDKMVQKNTDLGGHQKRSEDYRGISIETIIDEESMMLSYCFIDDCFIGAVNPDLLRFVVAHIKGATSPTLAGDGDYIAAATAVGPYHDVDFYVNIKQILKMVAARDAAGNVPSTTASLGLDNVVSFSCSTAVGRVPGSSWSGKAFLKVNGAKKGICKMFEVESRVLEAPRFMPPSTYSATFLNLDIKKIYSELYNILYGISPQYAAIMYMPLLPPSPEGEPGVELKTGIIDHLGSGIVLAQSSNKPFSDTSLPTESLVALAVNNRSALEKSFSLLYSKMGPEARRELLGHTIYLVTVPALPILAVPPTPMQAPLATTTVPMPKLAFAVTDTHLIIATEHSVERAIRALSSDESVSVTSEKWFTAAKSAVPSVVGLAGLQDNVASTEIFWWMMKKSGKGKTFPVLLGSGPFQVSSQGFAELVNASLLPDFDVVRKYFGSSAFYGVSAPEGFFFEFKYLNPTGTD
jgi:hypothetical protein